MAPDSVNYIAIARNLNSGAGLVTLDDSPLLKWPPLYPALLALLGNVFEKDPLPVANVVNALLFGLIVYTGGVLTFRHFSSFPALGLAGTLAILVSIPIFAVSVMAWTEPLFILFVNLSLLFANSYLLKKNLTNLALLALSVALSSLTRYIGVTLIFWGILIIVIFNRDSLKRSISHFSVFTIISAFPLGVWLIRNHIISSTFFGLRASSQITLFHNFMDAFNIIMSWYVPGIIANHRPTLILLGMAMGILAGVNLMDSWQNSKFGLWGINPIILFVIIYTAFLVISSTYIAYDRIGDRMLSPIYMPLTLLLIILVHAMAEPFRKRFSKKIVNFFLIIGVVIWLAYPGLTFTLNATYLTNNGKGYSSKKWKESETVQYLLQHPTLESECTIYTNGPEATYILAQLSSKMSPAKTRYNSTERVNDISGLRGSWPEESNACLVWFDKISRTYLFSPDELKTIAIFDLIARLEDGAIYSITRQ